MRYITVKADSEAEAKEIAKDKMEEMLNEGFDKNNFFYEVTDTEENV